MIGFDFYDLKIFHLPEFPKYKPPCEVKEFFWTKNIFFIIFSVENFLRVNPLRKIFQIIPSHDLNAIFVLFDTIENDFLKISNFPNISHYENKEFFLHMEGGAYIREIWVV